MPFRLIVALILCLFCSARLVVAQDMMRYIDVNSPEMTTAEMTREQVAALAAAATPDHPADFTGKRLSGLDLSGLNLSGAVFRAP
ncbi:MAG: pentapeptide repeat-containing protein, partial [Acidobacteriota bacterium]